MKVAIIGAGPAGITAGYQLSKEITEVDVYEAGPSVGGLAKTITLWGQKVDIGPHRFFSNDSRVNRLWLEVAGQDYEMVDRLTRIYYKKSFFQYPLKPFDALSNLGLLESLHCLLSYSTQRIRPVADDGSFENWVKGRFGKRLFEIFFKTYSEKLWGISCKDLDADFAAQRIKKLSLWEAVKNAFSGGKGNKHKTLVDQFAYPIGGTGMIYERMADFIKEQGGSVLLETPVKQVLVENGRATGIELEDGTVKHYDQIVSSMPLTLMVSRLSSAPEAIRKYNASLKYRNTIVVFLRVEAKDLFKDNWLYIHSTELKTGRITNFRNWVPQLYGESTDTILALEYWCNDEDEFWGRDDQSIIEMAKLECKKTGLTQNASIPDGFVYRIPKCYPVYDRGYKDRLKPVENYLSTIQNLQVIGRYGAFKYNNQDHSILMGILAAENILKKSRHDLWQINTDYESYQESSVITKTGLHAKVA